MVTPRSANPLCDAKEGTAEELDPFASMLEAMYSWLFPCLCIQRHGYQRQPGNHLHESIGHPNAPEDANESSTEVCAVSLHTQVMPSLCLNTMWQCCCATDPSLHDVYDLNPRLILEQRIRNLQVFLYVSSHSCTAVLVRMKPHFLCLIIDIITPDVNWRQNHGTL